MSSSPAHHNLYSYDDDAGLVDQVAPFLAAGLAEHEAVVIVVDSSKRAVLTDALGALAGRIDHIDRDGYYTRPEDALAGYDARVRRYVQQGRPASASSASCRSAARRPRATPGSSTRRC
jgi:hypothetical protein